MNELTEEQKDALKKRIRGYCPHCDSVHVLKVYTQSQPAKYNIPDKDYADCTHCGNTFRYPAQKPYNEGVS